MHDLTRWTLPISLLAIACNPQEPDDDGASTVPMTGSATGTGSGTSDEPETTEAPGTTDEPMTTGSSSTDDGPMDGSSSEGSETSAGGMPGDWLLTVDNGTNPPRLLKVGLDGATTEICSLAPTVTYTSLVFERDGTLYGHNAAASRIDTINPCNCSFQIVGPTSLGSIVLSLGAVGSDELLGLDTALDAMVRVDPDTGLGTVVGPLGFMYGTGAMAWSDLVATPYAIEGDNDYLYTVNPSTGESTPLVPVSADLTDPGLAVHPNDDGLYACSGTDLYTVEPASGLMLPVATLGMTGACRTLTAPQTAVACVDSL
ncbi:MAG: hypothetical protein H6712_17735 [Myxococcales bacterium]|nr:hypothetical protein [Myxococcales bacterium]